MAYTISQLAKIAKITPRTLHHYDAIGLLKPVINPKNGYRLYGEAQLLRLQQILFFRELGFPLTEIKTILDQPDFDMIAALKKHRRVINQESKRLRGLIATIDNTINKLKGTHTMEDEELFDHFPEDEKKKMLDYHQEARQRWGNTDAWKTSQERYAKLTTQQRIQMKEDAEAFTREWTTLLEAGKPLESAETQAMVQKHRDGIHFFYDTTIEMYRGLADMYLQDNRFKAYYDKFMPGLAEYVSQAIQYYCDQHTD